MNMDYQLKPINLFQDDGLSKEDRAMINGMRETAYMCGNRGGDVEYAVHQTLKRMDRYDLLPPCERVAQALNEFVDAEPQAESEGTNADSN